MPDELERRAPTPGWGTVSSAPAGVIGPEYYLWHAACYAIRGVLVRYFADDDRMRLIATFDEHMTTMTVPVRML